MKNERAASLRELLANRNTAALGTLHSGAPYVSMVPFVLLKDGSALIIHVSRLAAHTKDMLVDPRVSLLITEAEHSDVSPLAVPRVTILGTARQLSGNTPEYPVIKEAYLARFPEAASIFTLGDFSLFVITVTGVRWIAGFAQAQSLSPAAFAKILTDSQD